MNPRRALSPERGLAAEIDRFAKRHDLLDLAADLDRRPRFPSTVFRAMGRKRLLGLSTPRRKGGRGLSLSETARALYYLAYRTGTTFAKLSLQPEFCGVLADRGSKVLVDKYYRPLVAGRLLIGNQLTEPGAGSDVASISTVARPTRSGFEIDGAKTQAAFAADADAALVYAKLSGAKGRGEISAFLVPQQLGGVRPRVVPDMGERWMRRGSVQYRSVQIPADHLIGAPGRALQYVRRELTRERALLAAIYLGVGRSAWEATMAHVGDRQVSGASLATRQGVTFPLVDLGTRLDMAELFVRSVVQRSDSGKSDPAPAAMAKTVSVELALDILDRAIQLHGGRGYSQELPFERLWRDVRSGALAHGSSEVMRQVAVRSAWPTRPAR